jgi:hypothetical protein
MVDMAAIASAAGALKTAFDISKTALSLRDASLIKAKVTEMQGEISSALASAIAAQTDQLAMLERERDLEKEVAHLKAWDADKERYQLERLPPGVHVYTLQQDMAKPGETPHSICKTCYQHGIKSVLDSDEPGNGVHNLTCQECGASLHAGIFHGQRRANTEYDPFSGR